MKRIWIRSTPRKGIPDLLRETDHVIVDGFLIAWGLNELDWPAAVTFHRGQRIGFANAEYHSRHEHKDLWNPHTLTLDAEFRGRGLGQWLLLALAEAVHVHKGGRLVPADWSFRHREAYVPGLCGTSESALRCWERLGFPL